MVMPVVIMSYMTCQGGKKDQMAVILGTNYTTTDSHEHSVIAIVATVYWLGLEGMEYDDIQRNLFNNADGMTKLHAIHWMGYKLEMMRDLQVIRPYSMLRARLYWPVHKHEMQVEQYAGVGMTNLVQITNRQHQGVDTNANDDEEGDEKTEDEEGAEQELNDDGRESKDGKEHTPTKELANTMAATHILDANRNVGKSYRAATMEGAAWSTIGPKG
eukprot:gene14740-31328_t